MLTIFRTMQLPTIAMPNDYNETELKLLSILKKKIWEMKIELYMKRRYKLEETLLSLYSVIWGQCSEEMQTK